MRFDKSSIVGLPRAAKPSASLSPMFVDLEGQRFDMLVVCDFLGRHGNHSRWRVLCDCGVVTTASTNELRTRHMTSCGCRRAAMTADRLVKHGDATRHRLTAEYVCHRGLRSRCHNPNNPSFPDYGGRGIYVCERWLYGDGTLSGYLCFLADMGRKPTPRHSIDRVDVNGPYSPENCRWATPSEQMRTKRTTRVVEYRGERIPFADLCIRLGVDYDLAHKRLMKGWPIEQCLTPSRLAGAKA